MKRIYLLALLVMAQTFLFAQEKWKVDNAHSTVRFSVSHLVISEVDGTFKKFDGNISTDGKSDFIGAAVNFSIDVNSISTDNEMRDKHLKGEDFFNAEKYPQMNFTGTSFTKIPSNKYALKGNLTIRDITKPVTFEVIYGGTAKDPYGNVKAGFKAVTKINRFDYGLKWNTLTEAGGATVGKEVTIEMKLEFTKSKA